MKKVIKIWLIASVVLGIFVGCSLLGVDSEPQTTEPKKVEQKQKQVEQKQKQVEPQDTETRDMIWDFMVFKGYDVKTVMGVPEIYKSEVKDGWHVKTTDGTEYAVVVFEGSVSAITPMNGNNDE